MPSASPTVPHPCSPRLHWGARPPDPPGAEFRSCGPAPHPAGCGRAALPWVSPMARPAPTCLFQGGEVLDTLQVGGQQDTEDRNLRGRETLIPGRVPLLQRAGTGGLGQAPRPSATVCHGLPQSPGRDSFTSAQANGEKKLPLGYAREGRLLK